MPQERRPTTPRLPRGTNALDRDSVSALHRERLQAAMVSRAADVGYLNTTITDLCAEAGVGSKAFYEQYPSKEALLLASCDAIVARADAFLGPSSIQRHAESLRMAFAVSFEPLARWAATSPKEARLVLLDVLSAGTSGPVYRRSLAAKLEQRLREAASATPRKETLSDASFAIVAGGALQVIESQLRSDKVRRARTLADELATWASSYATDDPMPLPAPRPVPPAPRERRTRKLPRGHHQLPRMFIATQQRERILEAVAVLAAEGGYAAMSVPDIVAEAHVSNRTFYEHFTSKQEAFIAAFDGAFMRLLAASWYASADQDDWPMAVRKGMRAWVGFITSEPEVARFGFNDVLTSGREGVDKVEEGYRAFGHLMSSGHGKTSKKVPGVAFYAIAGGIASLVATWIAEDRTEQLTELIPQLVFAVLAPFLGADEARRQAETT